MGNSTSSPAPNPSKDQKPSHDFHSSVHKSLLRTKKKSLELPDLASLTLSSSSSSSPYYHYGRPRHPAPAKSPCIPIPIPQSNNSNALYPVEPRTRPQNNFSTTDVLVTHEPSTRPFPPPTRGTANAALATPHVNGSANHYLRDDQQHRHYQSHPIHRHQQKMAQQRLQDLYNQSNDVPSASVDHNRHRPSPRPNGFVPEVVHSSVPIGLLKGITTDEGDLVPVKITWRGGGKSVMLARAGDDEWKGRHAMERESPTSQVYSTTVKLPRGTHHFRFLVDDHWRVADYLPTAVDDQGTLANYVAVPLSYSPPKTSPSIVPHYSQTQRQIPGQSFWSAASSADGDLPEPTRLHHRSSSRNFQSAAVWTSELPLELVEAAREEETYLQASAGQYEANESKGGGTTYVSGFVPAPNIPPAPGLPRHLDKLILNAKMSPAPGSTTPSKATAGGKAKGKDREKGDRDSSTRRHRDEKKDRRMPPPAPPPSEDGSSSGLLDPEPASMTANDQTPIPATPEPSAWSGIVPSTTTSTLDRDSSTSPARSRPIGIDPSSTPVLTDDASVLSVPSHVVLHHLCTSAIRNGVLAVANTTRYKEKFLTTVYYKPT